MTNTPDNWRVGTKVGRTIYRNNALVGMMDTPELARLVVDSLQQPHAHREVDSIATGGTNTPDHCGCVSETEWRTNRLSCIHVHQKAEIASLKMQLSMSMDQVDRYDAENAKQRERLQDMRRSHFNASTAQVEEIAQLKSMAELNRAEIERLRAEVVQEDDRRRSDQENSVRLCNKIADLTRQLAEKDANAAMDKTVFLDIMHQLAEAKEEYCEYSLKAGDEFSKLQRELKEAHAQIKQERKWVAESNRSESDNLEACDEVTVGIIRGLKRELKEAREEVVTFRSAKPSLCQCSECRDIVATLGTKYDDSED